MGEPRPEEQLVDTEETPTPPLNTLPARYAQDFIRIYGSFVTTSSNLFDLTLVFGQPITDDANRAYIEQKVAVTMSWQAAKAFAQLLHNALTVYESQVGEIRLTASLRPAQSDQPARE